MHKLLLMVTNALMLERGTLPYCYFDLSGGLVGSSSEQMLQYWFQQADKETRQRFLKWAEKQ